MLKMAPKANAPKKKAKNRFLTWTVKAKKDIFKQKKAPSTNQATKVWVKCLNYYLAEKNLEDTDTLDIKDLPNVLSDFYTKLRKADAKGEYKTSTLKCIRAAINRYFKETRSLDILLDPRFIRSNEMFTGVAKKAKEEGRGKVDSRPPTEEDDMKKISAYFAEALSGPPDAEKLIEMAIFSIIYYMCRRGRQNLRTMTKDTFWIDFDPTGRKFIYQAIKEHDKNHRTDDLSPNNQARIYEQPGNHEHHTNYHKTANKW